MASLFLIRHAEVENDYKRRFVGRTDPRLSKFGCDQAKRLTEVYPDCVGLPVHSSPMRRALDTAKLAFPNSEINIEPWAVEIDFGVLEGLHLETAYRLYPEALVHYRRNPTDAAPTGGEAWTSTIARAVRLAEKLDDGQSRLLISHNYFLSALLSVLRGLEGMRLTFAYAEAIRLDRDHQEDRWRVSQTNSSPHNLA